MVAVGKRLVSLIHWAEIKSDEARGTPKRSLLSFPTLGSSFFFFSSRRPSKPVCGNAVFSFYSFSLLSDIFSSLLFSFLFFQRASLFFEFQVERRDRFTLRTARLTRVGDRVQSRVQRGERGVSSV